MAPRLQLLMSSGSKEKEPRNAFFFSQEIPVNEHPPCSPAGTLERAACLQSLFYISLKFLIKIPLNTEIFPFYQRPYKRSVPPCSPKAGPLWEQTPISRSLLNISFGVLSKGALPPGSPHRAPSERRSTFGAPPSSICQSPW